MRSIFSMSEDRAYAKFCRLRWHANKGKPICPECGCVDHWKLATPRKFGCSGCGKQFSITTDTLFKSHKMSFRKMLEAIAIFTNGALGVSALRLSREINVSYKTAWVLAHKMREARSR